MPPGRALFSVEPRSFGPCTSFLGPPRPCAQALPPVKPGQFPVACTQCSLSPLLAKASPMNTGRKLLSSARRHPRMMLRCSESPHGQGSSAVSSRCMGSCSAGPATKALVPRPSCLGNSPETACTARGNQRISNHLSKTLQSSLENQSPVTLPVDSAWQALRDAQPTGDKVQVPVASRRDGPSKGKERKGHDKPQEVSFSRRWP